MMLGKLSTENRIFSWKMYRRTFEGVFVYRSGSVPESDICNSSRKDIQYC